MTDLQPYFTQIIDHNSVNVHRIPTKVGTEIRLNGPFKCAKCQPNPACIRVLWQILRSVRNEEDEEEKTKKLKRNFVCSYLGNGWSDLLQTRYVDSPKWAARL